MTTLNRHGKKWTTNEILTLQREYELLSLPIAEIADKHKRTPLAIVSKLEAEEFITRDMADRLLDTTTSVKSIEHDCLNRIWKLETSVEEIGLLVNELTKSRVSKKTKTILNNTSTSMEL